MPSLPYVFFDAAGTLFHLTESVGSGYARIASEFGFQLDPDTTDAAFRSAFAIIEQPSYPDGPDEQADRHWWKEFVARVFTDAGETSSRSTFNDCFDALFAFYGKAEAWQLFPETVEALQHLTHYGYEIGVLSNFDQRLNNILVALNVRDSFSEIIISSQIGATKPDPAIFHAAAQRVGRQSADCILIGDDPRRDAEGALAAGYRAAHLVDRPSTDLKSIVRTLTKSVSS